MAGGGTDAVKGIVSKGGTGEGSASKKTKSAITRLIKNKELKKNKSTGVLSWTAKGNKKYG